MSAVIAQTAHDYRLRVAKSSTEYHKPRVRSYLLHVIDCIRMAHGYGVGLMDVLLHDPGLVFRYYPFFYEIYHLLRGSLGTSHPEDPFAVTVEPASPGAALEHQMFSQ